MVGLQHAFVLLALVLSRDTAVEPTADRGATCTHGHICMYPSRAVPLQVVRNLRLLVGPSDQYCDGLSHSKSSRALSDPCRTLLCHRTSPVCSPQMSNSLLIRQRVSFLPSSELTSLTGRCHSLSESWYPSSTSHTQCRTCNCVLTSQLTRKLLLGVYPVSLPEYVACTLHILC